MDYVLFTLLVVVAQHFKYSRLYVLAKPMPMLFLIYRTSHVASTFPSQAILLGLVLGLVGDVVIVYARRWRPALMLSGVAFLLGHLAYVAAFVQCPLSAGRELWVAWMGLFLIFMHEYFYFMLKNAPVVEFAFGVVYWVAISAMFVASANADHFLWSAGHGAFPFAFVGRCARVGRFGDGWLMLCFCSFLFMLSDLCIHWIIFVDRDNVLIDKMILPLYFTGQMLISQAAISLVAIGV